MGCMNIVIFLLQHNANPDVPTVRGETPLHLAARANQTDIIRILLRNGAQVDARARVSQISLKKDFLFIFHHANLPLKLKFFFFRSSKRLYT